MRVRVRLFVDFWNLQLQWNSFHKAGGATERVRVPWDTIFPAVVTKSIDDKVDYVGTHVYVSVDRFGDDGLRRFLHVMDGFPGYSVTIKKRKPASRVHCKECDNYIDECPQCKSSLVRRVEKGVDTSLVTDLITMSLDDLHDRAVLVSADADFVPAVEYLARKGKRVTHAYFKGIGNELRKACWDHKYLDDLMRDLVPSRELEDPSG